LDGQNGSSTNAFLVLLSKLPLASSEELTSPSAFSTERTGPDLRAGCVPQVIRPIDLEPKMIVGVDHLVGHGVFQVPLILHLVGAEEDAILGIKATRFAIRTTTAVDIVTRQVASQLTDIIAQKADYRTPL
jgi:hypothetical protein